MIKTIGALVLAVVLAGSFGAFGPKQTMAAGGVATVTLTNIDGLSAGTAFDFELYKVGHFSGPGLVLEDEFKGSNANVTIPKKADYKAEDYGGKSWENAWLDSANTLGTFINSMASKPASIGGVHTLRPGESFSQPVTDNGLYLVMSKTVRDSENDKVNWTPQPMYISILNGDSEATLTNNEVVVKILRTPVPSKHKVTKRWEIPKGREDSLMPSEIIVNILYGGDVIDTVKLNNDNNWTYDWSSDESGEKYKYIGEGDKVIEFEPDKTNPKWSVVEIFDADAYKAATGKDATEAELAEISKLAGRFTVDYELPDPEITEQTGIEQFFIDNKYSKSELELTKKLDGFVDGGDRSNVTTAFRIVAKDADGNEIYNIILGISFAKDDEVDADGYYTKTRKITDIPVNADEITVTEVYSGQYKRDSEKSSKREGEIVFDSEKNLWTVTMDNTHDYHQGSGVVNKYGDGDLKDREGYIEHK